MKYLIDTNIAVFCINNDSLIVDKIRNIGKIAISVISVGELLYGVNISRDKDKNIIALRKFLKNIEIIFIDTQTANQYAVIRATLKKLGKPTPDNDIWIAATAKANNLTIATRDRHFLTMDFILSENW